MHPAAGELCSSSMAPRRATLARALLLPGLWAIIVAWMAVAAARDPFDPTRQGTSRYGHNDPGTLGLGIVVTLVELLLALAVLRPWKPGPAWIRLGVALVLLVPWGLFSGIMCLHAGSVFIIHFLWLALLLVAVVAALVGQVAGVIARKVQG